MMENRFGRRIKSNFTKEHDVMNEEKIRIIFFSGIC